MPQQPDIYSRWLKETKRQGIFHSGQRVGVAVSGGPDSVLLLHFMRGLASELGLILSAVHFNHHLRGAESDADEQFVQNLAASMEIDFIRGEADVARAARERKRNLEATARDLRYRFFFSLVNKGRLDKVATAHTASDQAETVLLRMLRGTGTRGLGGIHPVLEGGVVRPFLGLTRAEVMREIEARSIKYRTDTSNLDTRLRRNKLRKEILPLLEREFNPSLVPLLKNHADRARDEEAFLMQQARERSRPWCVREGSEEKIPLRALRGFPPAIQRLVLRQMLQGVRDDLRGVTYSHIEGLLQFAMLAQSGKSFSLPHGIAARKEFDWLILGSQETGKKVEGYAYPVKTPCDVAVPSVGNTFRFKIIAPQELPKGYNQMQAGVLDAEKLTQGLSLRGSLEVVEHAVRQEKAQPGKRKR